MSKIACILCIALFLCPLCVAAEAPATQSGAERAGAPLRRFPYRTLPDAYRNAPKYSNVRILRINETQKDDRLRLRIVDCLTELEFVKLPASTIDMPALTPDRELDPVRRQSVSVGPLWMATTETPWPMRDAMMLEYWVLSEAAEADGLTSPSFTSYQRSDRGFGNHGYATIGVTSDHARWYCAWLSVKTGKKYRLPTEAEWEYACRAGRPERKLTREELFKVAWVEENAEETPHPVGKKVPNPWGLYDMLGNVGEWALGDDRVWVQKGGSWYDPAKHATPSFRAPLHPDWHMTDPQQPKSEMWLSDGWHVGFRIVREPD